MVNPKELRIGNYLNRRGNYLKVESISKEIVRMSDRGYDSDYPILLDDQITGIELTDEILKRFTLPYLHSEWGELILKKTKHFSGKGAEALDAYYLVNKEDTGYIGRRIEYLHHLQNFVFDLSGEEIKGTFLKTV